MKYMLKIISLLFLLIMINSCEEDKNEDDEVNDLILDLNFDDNLENLGAAEITTVSYNEPVFAESRNRNSGRSIEFNGTNYIDITLSESNSLINFDINDGKTISSWVYLNTDDANPLDYHIDIVSHVPHYYYGVTTLGEFEFWTNYESGAPFKNTWVGDLEKQADFEWIHYVVSLESISDEQLRASIYVNGDLNAVENLRKIETNDNKLRIGARKEFENSWYAGRIDDLQMYNRALSADEIKTLYENQK